MIELAKGSSHHWTGFYRSALTIALAGSLLVALVALSGCERDSPSSSPVLTSRPAESNQGEAYRSGPIYSGPVSFAPLWTASVSAVEHLGPTRIDIVETWKWQTADPSSFQSGEAQAEALTGSPLTGSLSAQIEQLLDPDAGRGRLTVKASDGSVKITALEQGAEGTVKTTMMIPSADSASATSTFEQRHLLASSASRESPLPLYAGGMLLESQGYVDLLHLRAAGPGETLSAFSAAHAQGEKDHYLLTWETSGNELVSQGELVPRGAKWRLTLRPDCLPQILEVELLGELEGVTLKWLGRLEYSFTAIGSLQKTDVSLAPPSPPAEKTISWELPPEQPISPQADWGQYWLGPRFAALCVTEATHTMYELSTIESGTTVFYEDEVITLTYAAPQVSQSEQTQGPSPVVTLAVRRPLADVSRKDRERAEQLALAGRWERRTDWTAGKRALLYLGPPELTEPPWLAAPTYCMWISLDDAWIEAGLDAGVAPEDISEALRALK